MTNVLPAWLPTSRKVEGKVPAPLTEISGLVASRKSPGVFWCHNDSGDRNRVFAIDHAGKLLAEVTLAEASAVDWEDISIGWGPDGWSLYLADTGNNLLKRKTVTIWRAAEPDLHALKARADGVLVGTVKATALVVAYGKGTVTGAEITANTIDCEAMAVSPSGSLYLFGKRLDGTDKSGGWAPVYHIAGIHRASTPDHDYPLIAQPCARVHVPRSAAAVEKAGTRLIGPTGADITPSLIAVRVLGATCLWRRPPTETVAQTINRQPEPEALIVGGYAEAIAVTPEGVWTLPEGSGAAVTLAEWPLTVPADFTTTPAES